MYEVPFFLHIPTTPRDGYGRSGGGGGSSSSSGSGGDISGRHITGVDGVH
jgi:hypothetical protein